MRKYIFLRWVLVMLFATSFAYSHAQERIYSGIIPSTAPGPVIPFAVNSILTIQDEIYENTTLRPHVGNIRTMQNVVMLKINENSAQFVPSDFTVTVKVNVSWIDQQGVSQPPVDKFLQLSYKLGMAQKSDAASYFLVEEGGYLLTAEIKEITTNVAWDVIPFLQLVTQIRSVYDAPFRCDEEIQTAWYVPPATGLYDDLLVKWSYPGNVTGNGFKSFPSGFDLEWAWVEEQNIAGYQNNGNWDPEKIFFNNATRVTVPASQLGYRIPLFYDGSGRIFWRVRAIQTKQDGQILTGPWKTDFTSGNGMFVFTNGHEQGLNWQVTTTFAEDGLRKTVVSYADGTLRGRQTVTKDNAQPTPKANPTQDEIDFPTGSTVIAETFYDYQGRPAIQVLPSPTLNSVISFARNLNNFNTNYVNEPKEIYDLLQTGQPVCGNGAPALDKNPGPDGLHGAGNYYSGLNPLVNKGYNKFIPDANGFAFTETRYTQDATGRVAAQGGVGEAHRIGSGHETQYFYTVPDQEELDMLFGTDAGIASHYEKNYVKDANGQFSVSYVDMHGRTVATALAGSVPDNLQALPSSGQGYIFSAPRQLLTDETNVVNGRDIVMTKEIVITNENQKTRQFVYSLNPEQLSLQNCETQNICYDCLYDLTITVTNSCTGENVTEPIIRKNFTLPYTSICNDNPDGFQESFSVNFPDVGAYTITKILTLSKEAQDYFREDALETGHLICSTETDMYNDIFSVMQQNNQNCAPACESCSTIVSSLTAFRTKFMQDNNLQEAAMPPYESLVQEAYQLAKEQCDIICENGSDRVNNFRELMLLDMMPDRGQYARYMSDETDINGNPSTPVLLTNRDFNIFRAASGSLPAYKKPQSEDGSTGYRDEAGHPDPEAADLNNWNEIQFTEHFKETWANQLIKYHPEYGKLKLVESEPMKNAYRWQEQWQNKDTWAEVSAMMTGLPGSDPFFNQVLIPYPLLQGQLYGKIYNYLTITNDNAPPFTISMWQLAVASVMCKDQPYQDQLSCLQNYASNAIGAFPQSISCNGDRDMIWRVFRSLYFSTRESIIAKYLQQAAPVNESIFNVPSDPRYPRYIARFPQTDLNGMQSVLPAELNNAFNEAISTTASYPPASPQTDAAMQAQFQNTCETYADSWMEKITTAFPGAPQAAYDNLKAQLISICVRGSDEDHPLGSSSTAPDKQNPAPSTFEAAIAAFMSANNFTNTPTANPYILEWPKPYEASAAFGNEELWETKPESCVCTRINEIKAMYDADILADVFGGPFSSYLKEKFGTTMTDADLDELLLVCNPNTPPAGCRYRTTPIVLPPVLQCSVPLQTCLSCDSFAVLKTQFFTAFPNIPSGITIPVTQPASDLEMEWNQTFARFMNYKTGYAKQWHEYAAFDKTCSFFTLPASDPGSICMRYESILGEVCARWSIGDDEGLGFDDFFTQYFNTVEGTSLTYDQIRYLIRTKCDGGCIDWTRCTAPRTQSTQPVANGTESTACGYPFTPYLCGLNVPLSPEVELEEDNPCDDIYRLAAYKARDAWTLYLQTIKNNFDKAYQEKCLNVKGLESLTMSMPAGQTTAEEYHFTLYYYDQSGSLVQTVPPAGVYNYTSQTALNTFLDQVKASRIDPSGNGPAVRPAHTLVTKYRYNTLGQVVEQTSPDGGLSQFWYDELGRLVVSQNAKQRAGSTKRYSYTLYDELGRIAQVGEKPTNTAISQVITRDPIALKNWLNNTGNAKEQITRTVYDIPYNDGTSDPFSGKLVQQNLRNRVSYSQFVNTEPANAETNPNAWIGAHASATFYTYDIHGNVDELLQDYNEGPMKTAPGGNRFKKMAYRYDLISGKVNEVAYQPDTYVPNGLSVRFADRFYHKYDYDAESKLVSVLTSRDGIIWETDARYTYYKHGPLARTELGQQRVQGIDYAYTLQGWLKGVNSTALSANSTEECAPGTAKNFLLVTDRAQYGQPDEYLARQYVDFDPDFNSLDPDDFLAETNPNLAPCIPLIEATAYIEGDMGQDGKTTITDPDPLYQTHNTVARDAFSFSLNYYEAGLVKDYKPINSNVAPFAGGMFNLTTTDARTVAKPLFNGNIASMFVNIPKLGSPVLNGYTYDQLNRITAMDVFGGFNPHTNGFSGAPTASANYAEKVTYDPNGNILTYKRNGPVERLNMDDMSYSYKPGTNQLDKVVDAAPDAASGEYDKYNDIKRIQPNGATGQQNGNYQYDAIGNLVSDASEGITGIEWTVYGKISHISKTLNGANTEIYYAYDVSGNRISKRVEVNDGITGTQIRYTFYVRDASGNVMAVYEKGNSAINTGKLSRTEIHLYGSSRLGMISTATDMETPEVNYESIYTFERGNKFFELSNHLGNVLVTISDRKLQVQSQTNTSLVEYYAADIITANDYYPFGMQMPGRQFRSSFSYRYGFNGKETDNDISKGGSIYDFGFRIYNSCIAFFLSKDPLASKFPWVTPYQFAGNNPIAFVDVQGADPQPSPVTVVNVFIFTGNGLNDLGPNGNAAQNSGIRQAMAQKEAGHPIEVIIADNLQDAYNKVMNLKSTGVTIQNMVFESHGHHGQCFEVGTTGVDCGNIENSMPQLIKMTRGMTGSIVIMGCQIGMNRDLMSSISQSTGIDVIATLGWSTDWPGMFNDKATSKKDIKKIVTAIYDNSQEFRDIVAEEHGRRGRFFFGRRGRIRNTVNKIYEQGISPSGTADVLNIFDEYYHPDNTDPETGESQRSIFENKVGVWKMASPDGTFGTLGPGAFIFAPNGNFTFSDLPFYETIWGRIYKGIVEKRYKTTINPSKKE